ncbi:TraR/DksA family transcriptional regulator [Enhygromyxa salina]|uniref:RNA polymerase-binding transcription factor DksA n=1 Tax=Enhygromyxa salina TaxID=215803 RepID=A0A2S9YTA4_9BACT|nr:TraR/DksA C4-type zinc finger protein [Enhygromyxa salina]PRQ08345.1 RNA polymerase-binding transcription factor DksA [Enhygromyxa salina]
MSEPLPLTAAQQLELRAKLRALDEELLQLIEQTAEGAAPVDLDEPIGRLSRMEAMQQQAMTAANRRASERRREMIQLALSRLERGEYGECQSCEEPIGFRRLDARPETPLCLICQRALGG